MYDINDHDSYIHNFKSSLEKKSSLFQALISQLVIVSCVYNCDYQYVTD